MNEHFTKETLKLAVDNNPNLTDEEKAVLKAIIDKGRNHAEIFQDTVAYMVSLRVMSGNP